MNVLVQSALVLILAVALDAFLPEPPGRFHPVVWMGRLITALERRAPSAPAPALVYGGMIVMVVVGLFGVGAWWVMTALAAWGDLAHVVGGALLMRTTFTTRGLAAAADRTRRALAEDRLDEARDCLKSLVGRDPAGLDHSLIAAAAIESVAENTTDSFVGPWLAFAVLGVPAAVAYRAINTLDSMLGYRGAYEYLGKTSARLDDLVNLIPARLSAVLLLAGGALAGLRTRLGRRTMMRDRRLPASPNAGWTMSAMAGLLGVRLEKPGHYCLGSDLAAPGARDIGGAVQVARHTAALALVAALTLLALRLAIAG